MDITTIAAPHGPYPIYQQAPADRHASVFAKAVTLVDGIAGLAEIAAKWEASKPNRARKAVKDDAFTYSLYYSDGKMRGILFLDPVPVTGETHIADILVDRKATK